MVGCCAVVCVKSIKSLATIHAVSELFLPDDKYEEYESSIVLQRSLSSGVLFRFNKSKRRAVKPGRYGEKGELLCVGIFSAKSFSMSGILLSAAFSSFFGKADPISTTSFHLGVGIN